MKVRLTRTIGYIRHYWRTVKYHLSWRLWVAEWMDARHPTLCRAMLVCWTGGLYTFREALEATQLCRPVPQGETGYCGKCENNGRGWKWKEREEFPIPNLGGNDDG